MFKKYIEPYHVKGYQPVITFYLYSIDIKVKGE